MGADKVFEIQLEGKAEVTLPAERALLAIFVKSTRQSREEATEGESGFCWIARLCSSVADVRFTARHVVALLKELGAQGPAEFPSQAAVDYWSCTPTSEGPLSIHDYDNLDKPAQTYTASIEFKARFQDFDALGRFVRDVLPLPHLKTDPVTWILLEQTKEELKISLRATAARDAQRKANEYAQALGYNKVLPSFLQDGRNLYSKRQRGGLFNVAEEVGKNLAGRAADLAVDEMAFRYRPDNIKLTVEIDMNFYAIV